MTRLKLFLGPCQTSRSDCLRQLLSRWVEELAATVVNVYKQSRKRSPLGTDQYILLVHSPAPKVLASIRDTVPKVCDNVEA